MKAKIRRSRLEGTKISRWYLPVWNNIDKFVVEEWIFFLAIPVLFFKIINHILWILWLDLCDFHKKLIKTLEQRRNK